MGIIRQSDVTYMTAFDSWLAGAARGDRFIYHAGLIASDREVCLRETGSDLSFDERKQVWREARAAWTAYEQKKVLLTQRRIGEGRFDYIAIRCR